MRERDESAPHITIKNKKECRAMIKTKEILLVVLVFFFTGVV